ncbi:exopolysaccharide biosynthesis polyprenyl glycosylphosphotransferase [Sphingobacterium alkalisoli]|uniref:Exopolysaccharide biosynthesis polyprenyl glycosylphosphotransferase n=1 Tax=Sphingobacterium alkalisoli TaxID=1874115 RepID=A0A4U0GR37_9SPHI|nr:exopolysaccharide biosynthesis polyprenyl glycosylphosphotransferase [Sphingobacterium alkalisoli]TJY61353.1 exopolysaccharide biosynthesis polyprenyl glycosylphosphotransferase [Sphingobacterium alkalisoli]
MHKYVQSRMAICLKMLLISMDIAFLNLLFFFAVGLAAYYPVLDPQGVLQSNQQAIWLMFNMTGVVAAMMFRMYSDESIERLENMFRTTWKGGVAHILIFSISMELDQRIKGVLLFLVSLATIMVLYYIVSRMFMTYVYTVFPKRFNWYKQIAIIGNGAYLAPVASYFERHRPFYHVNTIQYKDEEMLATKEENLARFKKYFQQVSTAGIHDVFIVTSPDMYSYSHELVQAADHQCVQLNFVPAMTANISYSGTAMPSVSMELPVIQSHGERMSNMENRVKKRLIDMLISGLVIVFLLSWMVPLIGLLIKLQSPGPIFFKQLRSGRNNKPFYCYKFRSMVVNKDSNAKQATKDDKRVTPIGKFLRKSSLDEFPQFINVFLGQMSVVGPRPHMLSHTEHYSQLIQHYMVRQFVKPGITGWAQVNGYRGETKDPELMARRVEHDIDYMQNWSAMLDFKIVCMTAINIAGREKDVY